MGVGRRLVGVGAGGVSKARCLSDVGCARVVKVTSALPQVFKPDKMNGFEPQSEASAMMERQRLDILPRLNNKNA